MMLEMALKADQLHDWLGRVRASSDSLKGIVHLVKEQVWRRVGPGEAIMLDFATRLRARHMGLLWSSS